MIRPDAVLTDEARRRLSEAHERDDAARRAEAAARAAELAATANDALERRRRENAKTLEDMQDRQRAAIAGSNR
jgi:hypothetical protein